MLLGRFVPMLAALALGGALAKKKIVPGLGRDVPHRRADVRRPARRRDRAHRRPDDLPRPDARADRRRIDALMRNVVSSVIAIVVITAVFGFGYPLVMTGFAQVAFKSQAEGSLITVDGKVVGSKLAAQAFTSAQLLPRASVGDVAGLQRGRDDLREPRPDEPGSREERQGRRAGDPEARRPVQPGPDDPRHPGRRGHDVGVGHRSRHLARLRAAPGAPGRGSSSPAARDRRAADQAEHTHGRSWGFFGEPGVNVLELNLALDKESRADGPSGGQHLLARPRARGRPRLVPEARSAAAAEEPGDVHRRARQRDHDRASSCSTSSAGTPGRSGSSA